MADDKSFDIVSKVDLAEVENAINQAMKEIYNRYDFKGTKTKIELDKDKNEIRILSDDDFRLKSVIDVLETKFVKRKIPIKALEYGTVESASGGAVRQSITLQQGIPMDKAKEIIKILKAAKMKLQGEIQKDQVRIRGKKLDDLQTFMSMLKEKDIGIHMDFVNYR